MKTKLLSMLALFASLALVSCGGKTNNGAASSGSSAPAHVHTFDESKWESDVTAHWHPATCEHTAQKGDRANHTLVDFSDATHVNKDATCKEEGVKYEKCSICGYIKETKLNKLDHAFGEWSVTKEATCSSEGSRERICSACQEKESEVIKALPHSWTVKEEVAAAGDGMAYQIIECSSCHKLAVRGDFTNSIVSGSSKTVTTADGNFVKLSANDGSYTIKINVDAAYAKTGKMYLHACMGHWRGSNGSTDNSTESYFSGNAETGNFKLEVNGVAVDFSAMQGLTYADLINDPDPGDSNGYSKAADCEVGVSSLQEGLNTIVYTRLASYNLTIQSFIFVLD